MTEQHKQSSDGSADLIQFAAHMARLLYNDATLDDCTEEQKRAWLSAAKALMTIYDIRTRDAAQAVGMRECQCDQPMVKCDHTGCRCTQCGEVSRMMGTDWKLSDDAKQKIAEIDRNIREAPENIASHSRLSAATGDDLTAGGAWNDGCDFAMTQLCIFLGVDQNDVRWDAATETVDGDVQAVIGNILRAKFGEDWGPDVTPTEPQAARTRSAIMHVLGKFHRNSSYPEASDVELGIYADEILALSRPAPQAAPVTDEIKKLRAAVEYWRLAAERRDARRDLTGLDIPEAQTLDAPEPQTAANPTYPTDPADKKLAADWYTWGFQAGMEAERRGAARDAASSPLSRPNRDSGK